MARRRYSAEEIVNKLRQAEVLIAGGKTVADRALAGALQHRAATLVARLPPAGTRNSGDQAAGAIC